MTGGSRRVAPDSAPARDARGAGPINQQSRPPKWTEPGYSKDELMRVQEKWHLRFPPDLLEFLLRRRPFCVGEGFFDWVHSPDQEIQQLLVWPFNGFWFDVQHNGVWWSAWGPKPESQAQQMNRLKEVFGDAPKLIPIYGRRYVPAEPQESGNPVLSVYQTDVICFGQTLEHWLQIEFAGSAPPRGAPEKEIPFWSRAIRENEARFGKS